MHRAAGRRAGTLNHPIPIEDDAIGLIRFEGGAMGQVECSWTFRGGMDLCDGVSGTESPGSITVMPGRGRTMANLSIAWCVTRNRLSRPAGSVR